MKFTVKVDPSRAKHPARHVSKLLRGAGSKGRAEEVFPGLRTGSSAGLVSVQLPDTPDAKIQRNTLKALRDDDAIAYIETTKPRNYRG